MEFLEGIGVLGKNMKKADRVSMPISFYLLNYPRTIIMEDMIKLFNRLLWGER